ncbi:MULTISPECIES: enoyl-CoA hydratase/isomerase family protein [Acinetobacter calcoaceticus/baumannii complex]|uniref:enoyl-CoA hydratase/isomerase family protein n=1 Tax=Acinetobacter calcoaceticus/baumannii complex TaxID=909768 RepID=UPI00244736E1|nr:MULTISPECIES: enoyl-CoA hydratase/isomerase family protein [Acinetobacter calcoaceticus/baumannii complex]MDH2595967.1 enoyl-CoA hydratase/isomerase family protein [Acinetobacter baumannii]MDO7537213.1 enoyl-CoA hydratase/isomerase family protein [Acinetobacter pittii]
MNESLLVNIENNVAYLTLNRPQQGNAIDLNLAKELLQAAIKCDQDPTIRCVVLTGAGRFFCAGGDVAAFEQAQQQIPSFLSELAGILHLAISRFMRMGKPLLVVVNGTAAGAGLSLALIGDYVIADEKAQFAPAYSAIGLSPDAGLTWHLTKLVGLRKAQEILFLNQKLSAEESYQIGLISKVVDAENLLALQNNVVKQLVNSALPALGNIKQLLLSSHQNSLETHLELEARAIANISLGAPAQEGLAAFLEKRPAQFNKD